MLSVPGTNLWVQVLSVLVVVVVPLAAVVIAVRVGGSLRRLDGTHGPGARRKVARELSWAGTAFIAAFLVWVVFDLGSWELLTALAAIYSAAVAVIVVRARSGPR